MNPLARLLAAPGDLLGIGLSGGTSADGIDAALVRFPGGATEPVAPELLAWRTEPLTTAERELVFDLADAPPERLVRADLLLANRFADAALAVLARCPTVIPDFAACGGQTVAHFGRRGTLQLGCPARLALRLGIPVVARFRATDVAAGGEGAPLAPFLDWVLFRDAPGTVALNLGGIANVTYVARDAAACAAFDTGPANSLLDRCARWASGGVRAYDEDGALARAGRADEALLAQLLAHPYFARPFPKSTGLELFGDGMFADVRARAGDMSAPNLAATLVELSARSVAMGVRALAPRPCSRVVATGGGARNPALMAALARALAPVPIAPYAADGWVDAKEAVLFALLGHETLRGRASSLPGATGTPTPRVLGGIYPA